MANYERRVYEPSDEVRVFDGSEEDDDVEGSRLPLLIVLALLVLAMFAGVVWLAYTQGVARGRGETPILTAANGPEKVAPPQAGGTNVPYQGFKIYEQPAPADDGSDAPPVDAAQPAPAAAPPPPVAAAPTAPPAAAEPKPAASVPAPKPAAAPPNTVASLIQQSQTPPPPTMKPAVTNGAPATSATSAPRALTPSAPAPVAATPAAAGSYVLQIGAFKSQAEADAAWRAYRSKHAALLTGYSPDVRQVDLGEKGTWYRLRIAGFNDREVASALCDRLKADGGGCFLGR
ncbi:MAG: hypothetical protein RJB58_917 [Pseudomonadota bacterium]|jgi:hypothetical protein